jgi:hypothetical protein
MKLFLLAAALALCGTATGLAATPNWLGELLGDRPIIHHARRAATPRPVRPKPPRSRGKPAAAPAIPLPRPRPAETPLPKPPPPVAAPAGPVAPPKSAESAAPHPPRVFQTACPAVIAGAVIAKPLPPIDDGQCRAPSPLVVTALTVNGRQVPLSNPATLDCQMASDLPGWAAAIDDFAASTLKTRLRTVAVGGSYDCRARHTPDAADTNLSEHGRADAVDITGFGLADGRTLTVGADYGSAEPAIIRFLHFAHDAACARFTTVLGPDANSLHHDHFHLDLACHGQSCTYRLCE